MAIRAEANLGVQNFQFIDRATGVCGAFGCNLLPVADPQIELLMKVFEEETYKKALEERRKTRL